jgi:hypothetical protein
MINVGGDLVWTIYWNYCLKFELLSHGNDFKIWEKQNLQNLIKIINDIHKGPSLDILLRRR